MNATTTTPVSSCPAWCTASHDEYDAPSHGNIDAPAVEVIDDAGRPSVMWVDIEQREADAQPRILLHGPTSPGQSFQASDARRIALAMLAQLDLIEAGNPSA